MRYPVLQSRKAHNIVHMSCGGHQFSKLTTMSKPELSFIDFLFKFIKKTKPGLGVVELERDSLRNPHTPHAPSVELNRLSAVTFVLNS